MKISEDLKMLFSIIVIGCCMIVILRSSLQEYDVKEHGQLVTMTVNLEKTKKSGTKVYFRYEGENFKRPDKDVHRYDLTDGQLIKVYYKPGSSVTVLPAQNPVNFIIFSIVAGVILLIWGIVSLVKPGKKRNERKKKTGYLAGS